MKVGGITEGERSREIGGGGKVEWRWRKWEEGGGEKERI